MPSTPPFSGLRATRGLTLLELLLVMVLLVVVSAMIVPQITSVTTRRELTSGAEQVRSALTKTQNQAMRRGEQVVLLYQPGTPFYARIPAPTDEESATKFEATRSQLTQLATVGEEIWDLNTWDHNATPQGTNVLRLPRDVSFMMPPNPTGIDADFGISSGANTEMLSGGVSALTGSSILPMIRFQPDGTASNAQLNLRNVEGDQVTISIRGLTGIVSVGEIRLVQVDEFLSASPP